MCPQRNFDCTWKIVERDRNGLFHGFSSGDRVYDRYSGRRGTLLPSNSKQQATDSEESSACWQMHYDGDDVAVEQVSSRQLVPVFANDDDTASAAASTSRRKRCYCCQILVTSDTDTFRLLASSQVSPTTAESSVLEIGCSTGGTSEILWSKPIPWIGWDVSPSMVQTVQRKLKQQQQQSYASKQRIQRVCHQMDALKDPETAAAFVMDTFGSKSDNLLLTVLVDIGGNRDEAAVVLMLQWILTRLGKFCMQIILKSEAVHAALHEQLINNNTDDDKNAWFQKRVKTALRETLPKHPLQASKRFASSGSMICRYHNYHEDGCAKFNDPATQCPYDHEHCHFCLETGHVARNCPSILS